MIFFFKANGWFAANGVTYYTFDAPIYYNAPTGNTLYSTTQYNSLTIYSGEAISGNTGFAMAITTSGVYKYTKGNLFSFLCQYGMFTSSFLI